MDPCPVAALHEMQEHWQAQAVFRVCWLQEILKTLISIGGAPPPLSPGAPSPLPPPLWLPPPPPVRPCCPVQEMQEHLRSQPGLLQEILKSLFEVILFEENSNQWSLSRPMLSLILINEPVYLQVRCM
jgi:hypothetical protein